MKNTIPVPLGFRFEPTDEEIIRFFLFPWVVGAPLPSNAIVYKQMYGPTAAPWSVFAGDDDDSRWETKEEGGATKSTTFVFTNLTRVNNSKRISRTSGGGTWGGQTGPKKIFSTDTGEVIGHMRMLSFEHPDCGASSALGHWIMHEYVLSDKILKEIGKDGAGDMVVCKITKCVKNSGGKRRQPQFFPPAVVNVQESGCKRAAVLSAGCIEYSGGDQEQPPQPQFFPPSAVVNVQESGCERAAEEYRVQEVREISARCIEYSGGDQEQPPQPQFFPPSAVVNVQETGRKRVAEESRVQETVCKKHKSGDGSVTEEAEKVEVVQEAEKVEVIQEAEKVDDSWLVEALEQDVSDEEEDESDDDGLREAAENLEALGIDDNFDVGMLLGYEGSNCNGSE